MDAVDGQINVIEPAILMRARTVRGREGHPGRADRDKTGDGQIGIDCHLAQQAVAARHAQRATGQRHAHRDGFREAVRRSVGLEKAEKRILRDDSPRPGIERSAHRVVGDVDAGCVGPVVGTAKAHIQTVAPSRVAAGELRRRRWADMKDKAVAARIGHTGIAARTVAHEELEGGGEIGDGGGPGQVVGNPPLPVRLSDARDCQYQASAVGQTPGNHHADSGVGQIAAIG